MRMAIYPKELAARDAICPKGLGGFSVGTAPYNFV